MSWPNPVATVQNSDVVGLVATSPPTGEVPRIHTGTAWFDVWAAAIALVVFVVFVLLPS